MGKKTHKHKRSSDFDTFDDVENFYDEEFDSKELSRDIYSTEWGMYPESDDLGRPQSKSRRQGGKNRVYSELNDWEEFGERDSWYMH